MSRVFANRQEAGRELGRQLALRVPRGNVLVLGLPRGGVPVAYEVAETLNAPLDVYLVRKLGVPGHEELAMGAIAGGGIRVLNQDIVEGLDISKETIDRAATEEQGELQRRDRMYRGNRLPVDVSGRVVVLVDDGLATGATMRAAAAALRKQGAARIIVGVPVGAAATCESMHDEVDDVVCVTMPEPFRAVGLWYEDFSPTTDEEVRELLDRAAPRIAVAHE